VRWVGRKNFSEWVRSGSRLYYISRLALLALLSSLPTLAGPRHLDPYFTGFIRKYWGRYHLQRTTRGGYIYHKLLTQRTPHWNLFDDWLRAPHPGIRSLYRSYIRSLYRSYRPTFARSYRPTFARSYRPTFARSYSPPFGRIFGASIVFRGEFRIIFRSRSFVSFVVRSFAVSFVLLVFSAFYFHFRGARFEKLFAPLVL